MKILIFGASGGTGRHLIIQGLKQGHQITAFVRNPAALPSQKHLFMYTGNLANAENVAKAIKGRDVVISVLGNKTRNALWHNTTVISDGVKSIIAGMKQSSVKRLLFVASFGVNKNIFLLEKLFIRIVLKDLFADIPRQEALIKQSGLDWTIVHPARLTNEKKIGTYQAGEELFIGPLSHIARADVADYLLKSIQAKETIGKVVTLRY